MKTLSINVLGITLLFIKELEGVYLSVDGNTPELGTTEEVQGLIASLYRYPNEQEQLRYWLQEISNA